jgi:hypothetical protein
MQFQILSKNPERAGGFFSKLFDWKVDAANALGYRTIKTAAGRGIDGGIWPCPPEGRPFIQLYVEVSDVPGTVEKATKLGATVIIPPQKLPDGDEIAILNDLEGMSFGIFRPDR